MDEALSKEELRWLWEHPQARQIRHLALRQAATTYLTDEADTTEEWALPRIAAYLQRNEAYRQRPFLLDAGCGPGYYLASILANPAINTALAVGLDLNREALLKAQPRLTTWSEVGLIQADVLKLPFGPGAFGAAMCNRMLNQTGDIAGALAAVAAALLRGGLIFIITADSGEVSPLRAAHEHLQADLGFPERLYQHTTRPDQRFNLSNGKSWLSVDYRDSRVELYERHLKFLDFAELGKYYASGLLFQKSSGLSEPEVSPSLWLELYSKVMGEMRQFIQDRDHLSYQERAALFSAARN